MTSVTRAGPEPLLTAGCLHRAPPAPSWASDVAPKRWTETGRERDRGKGTERDKDVEKPVYVRDRDRGPRRTGVRVFRQVGSWRPGLGGQTGRSLCLREPPLQPVAFWGEPRGYQDHRSASIQFPSPTSTSPPTLGLVSGGNGSSPLPCHPLCSITRLKYYLKNWVCLLVAVKPKTQPRQRSGEGRTYYYLQPVRRTPGIFLKAVSP